MFKTIPDVKVLKKRLTVWFNKYIRLRDRNRPCISCGIRSVSDAGHYWSTQQCPNPSMRYNEKNVNGQCAYCNRMNQGASQGYREGLIRKYGPGVIEELDIVRSVGKTVWAGFEYLAMIDHYKKKCKELENVKSH